jgi:hypothetical protein
MSIQVGQAYGEVGFTGSYIHTGQSIEDFISRGFTIYKCDVANTTKLIVCIQSFGKHQAYEYER